MVSESPLTTLGGRILVLGRCSSDLVLISLDQVLQEAVDTGMPAAIEAQHLASVVVELRPIQTRVYWSWTRIDKIALALLCQLSIGLIAALIRQPEPVEDEGPGGCTIC